MFYSLGQCEFSLKLSGFYYFSVKKWSMLVRIVMEISLHDHCY